MDETERKKLIERMDEIIDNMKWSKLGAVQRQKRIELLEKCRKYRDELGKAAVENLDRILDRMKNDDALADLFGMDR